jgi:hypothetical protein
VRVRVDADRAAEIPDILRALADQIERELRTTFPIGTKAKRAS